MRVLLVTDGSVHMYGQAMRRCSKLLARQVTLVNSFTEAVLLDVVVARGSGDARGAIQLRSKWSTALRPQRSGRRAASASMHYGLCPVLFYIASSMSSNPYTSHY